MTVAASNISTCRVVDVDVLRFSGPVAPPTPTVTISASPTSISAGESSTLSWSSTNADSCTASDAWSGTKPTSGSELVSPTQTSTYSLTCTGTGGSGSAGATVTVTPPTAPAGATLHSFGSVLVDPEFNLNGAGSNVDSIAFWEAPDPAQSLMFVSSKSAALVEVWRSPFKSAADQQTPLKHSCFGSGTNGVLVDQRTDLLYVSPRNTWVCVFRLPELAFVRSFDTSSPGGSSEPNLALLPISGDQDRLYVSYDTIVQMHDPATGMFQGRFTPQKGLEAMLGDPYHQVLYIPDENGHTGVYVYGPDGAYTGTVFGSDVFQSDAEGVALYECSNGDGLIVVSDQRTTLNDYEVFDRRTKKHLGALQLTGIANTDGIASTQQPSTAYPGGLFSAIHSDTSVAGLGWSKVFTAISAKTGFAFGCP